jgi:hypothetical protein
MFEVLLEDNKIDEEKLKTVSTENENWREEAGGGGRGEGGGRRRGMRNKEQATTLFYFGSLQKRKKFIYI